MEEPHYCCGIAAGMMTKSNKIGFVGPKPLYFIFNNCNGFILGARSVNPPPIPTHLRIETAERRGVRSCGYHTDLSSLAPKGFITGAEWNWAKGADLAMAWQSGGNYPNLLIGDFRQDLVAISPFGSNVSRPGADQGL